MKMKKGIVLCWTYAMAQSRVIDTKTENKHTQTYRSTYKGLDPSLFHIKSKSQVQCSPDRQRNCNRNTNNTFHVHLHKYSKRKGTGSLLFVSGDLNFLFSIIFCFLQTQIYTPKTSRCYAGTNK